jgi:hypothetical protein
MSDLIKRPYQQSEFTPEMIEEVRKCALDPIYFIKNYVMIQHPTKGAIKFNLFSYQERAIRAFQENRWTITLQSRQSGKTTVIAAFLLWYTCFQFDKKCLVASNKNSNAMEIMDRIKFAYEELPMWLKPGCLYYNRHEMSFDNGSKIFSEATTENTGRGKSISLLMLDELAFVPKRIQELLWTSIMPTLSTGGACIISSTPNGDDDLFAEKWRGAKLGTNGFYPVEVHWSEHPDRGEKFKAEIMPKVGEHKWLQEYENQFLSSDQLLIKSITLQNFRSKQPLYIDKGFKVWKEPTADRTYLVGVDVAQGLGADFSTVQVFELETLEQIMEFRDNKINETQLYNAVKFVVKQICSIKHPQTGRPPVVYWSFENNAIGAAIQALYMNDDSFPDAAELISVGSRLGLTTTNKSKIVGCKNLKRLLEKTVGGMIINSELLLAELKNFVLRGASYQAKSGATDDLISATLIIMGILQYLSEHDSDVFQKVYDAEQDFYDDQGHDDFDSNNDPVPFVM